MDSGSSPPLPSADNEKSRAASSMISSVKVYARGYDFPLQDFYPPQRQLDLLEEPIWLAGCISGRFGARSARPLNEFIANLEGMSEEIPASVR